MSAVLSRLAEEALRLALLTEGKAHVQEKTELTFSRVERCAERNICIILKQTHTLIISDSLHCSILFYIIVWNSCKKEARHWESLGVYNNGMRMSYL